jgi:hypothetical protein
MEECNTPTQKCEKQSPGKKKLSTIIEKKSKETNIEKKTSKEKKISTGEKKTSKEKKTSELEKKEGSTFRPKQIKSFILGNIVDEKFQDKVFYYSGEKYNIRPKPIGSGSYGVVLLAEYTGSEKKGKSPIVIKVIPKDNNVISELDLWRKLSYEQDGDVKCSTYIICLKDYFESPNKVYYVMEFFPGIDLFDYINSHIGKCTLNFAVKICRRVCEAEKILIERFIINRDIKVENVLIHEVGHCDTKEGEPIIKMIDLGFASSKKHIFSWKTGNGRGYIDVRGSDGVTSKELMETGHIDNKNKPGKELTEDEAWDFLVQEDVHCLGILCLNVELIIKESEKYQQVIDPYSGKRVNADRGDFSVFHSMADLAKTVAHDDKTVRIGFYDLYNTLVGLDK